jgi:hypothetical protein
MSVNRDFPNYQPLPPAPQNGPKLGKLTARKMFGKGQTVVKGNNERKRAKRAQDKGARS